MQCVDINIIISRLRFTYMSAAMKFNNRYLGCAEIRFNGTRKTETIAQQSPLVMFGVRIIHPRLLRELSETLPFTLIYDCHAENRRLRSS